MSFIEQDCTFSVEGKTFTSGGSYLVPNKRGRLVGLFYAYPKEDSIGNWSGDLKIPARYSTEYYSNFGDKRQTLYFEYEGKAFIGIWYKSGSDIVRVREVRK